MLKKCSICKVEKETGAFWADKRSKDGRMAHCAACKSDRNRRYARDTKDYEKRRYWKDPQAHRERHLVRKYGVDLIEYQRMFEAQGGACAVCRRTQERAFDIDHDHTTGRVRGLLCTSCNRMIGHAGDDPDVLRAAADYLVPQVGAAFVRAVMADLPKSFAEADHV